MPYKWKCHDCGEIHATKNDLVIGEERDPYATGDSWYTHEVLECGTCGSENVEETWLCETCGVHEPMVGYDDCATCITEGAHPHTSDYGPEAIAEARKCLTV